MRTLIAVRSLVHSGQLSARAATIVAVAFPLAGLLLGPCGNDAKGAITGAV
jgi:hypothetical protein